MGQAQEKKHSNDEWKWLSSAETDTPILPTEKCKYNHDSEGWKYYLIIKPDLQDWWDEFNGKLDKKGRVYFKTLDQFIRWKTSSPKHRKYLLEMMGPIPEFFGKKRLQVPWLGDWYRRRKNGSWSIDNKIQLKGLKKAIERQVDSMEAVKACAPFLVQEMLQYTRLTEKINSVFGNEPFFSDEAPTSKSNTHRFRTYLHMLGKVTGMKMKLIQEWMRVNGIDPRNPHEMWDMATIAQLTGSVGAAGALTGFTAAQGIGLPTSPFQQRPEQQYTKDTLLLAEHLTEHAKIFKKPLKSLDEKDVVDVKAVKVKEKDKSKTNGKHTTQ